jgi:hypothetical protein
VTDFHVPGALYGVVGGLLLLLARHKRDRDTMAQLAGRIGIGLGLAIGLTEQVSAWFPSIRPAFITSLLMGFGTEVVPIVVAALQELREQVRKIIKARGKAIHGQPDSGPTPLGKPEPAVMSKEAQTAMQLAIRKELEGKSGPPAE